MEGESAGQTYSSSLGICKINQGKSFWPFANLTDAFSGIHTVRQSAFLQEGDKGSFEMEYDTFKRGTDLKSANQTSSTFMKRSTSKQSNEQELSSFTSNAIEDVELMKDAQPLIFKPEVQIHGFEGRSRKGMNKQVVHEIVKGVYALSAPTSDSRLTEGGWSKSEISTIRSHLGQRSNRQMSKTCPLDCSRTGTIRSEGVDHDFSAEQGWEFALTTEPIPVLSKGKCSLIRQSWCGQSENRPIRASKITLKKLPIRLFESHSPATIKTLKLSSLPKASRRCTQRSKESEASWKKKVQTVRVLKQLVCGGFAGVVSRTAVAPLDLIKAYLITSHALRGSRKSALTICKDILDRDGWQGLFRGNLINCIRVAPSKAIELCVFETVRRALNKDSNPLKHLAATIAGGAAGMAGTIATYPLELLRTRISVQPDLYTGLAQAVTKIFQDEGLLAFYSGLTPSLVGVFPYAATNYFVYDGLRVAYCRSTGEKKVPTLATLAFGAVAAAASSTVTYPLEVARRQMQLSLSGAFARKSTAGVILEIYQHEGFLALYRGLGTTWLKLIPAAGISFVCYETARLALQIDDASLVKREAPIIAEQES